MRVYLKKDMFILRGNDDIDCSVSKIQTADELLKPNAEVLRQRNRMVFQSVARSSTPIHSTFWTFLRVNRNWKELLTYQRNPQLVRFIHVFLKYAWSETQLIKSA